MASAETKKKDITPVLSIDDDAIVVGINDGVAIKRVLDTEALKYLTQDPRYAYDKNLLKFDERLQIVLCLISIIICGASVGLPYLLGIKWPETRKWLLWGVSTYWVFHFASVLAKNRQEKQLLKTVKDGKKVQFTTLLSAKYADSGLYSIKISIGTRKIWSSVVAEPYSHFFSEVGVFQPELLHIAIDNGMATINKTNEQKEN